MVVERRHFVEGGESGYLAGKVVVDGVLVAAPASGSAEWVVVLVAEPGLGSASESVEWAVEFAGPIVKVAWEKS
jgi:hypothetical protein